MCGWDPRDDNSTFKHNGIIVKHSGIVVRKHTVSEYSRSRRSIALGLLISANTLVASTKCNHIVLPCTIASNETSSFNTFAMADCGATALFIDSLFAQLHGLKFSLLQHPQDLTVADGRSVSSRTITHTIQISFTLEAHTKTLKLFVTTLGQYPVVLGLPWLQKHDPHIHFHENTVTFDSKRCLEHCISTHQAMTICGADNTFDTLHEIQEIPHKNPAEILENPHKIHESHESHDTHKTTHEIRRSTAPKPQNSPRSSHCINMVDCTRKMNRELTLLENPTVLTEHALTKDIASVASILLDISMIGAAPFNHLVQKSQKNPSEVQIFSVTLRDINIALAPKKHTNPATKLPSKYHNFLDVFSRKDADVLPKHRPGYDHTIELMEGKAPTWGLLYSMSADELKVLKAYIEKMVDKGFIQASSSSTASPVLFAKKPGGGLRFYINYQALNTITVKN